MGYPDKFIRGVSSLSYVDVDGRATAEIFLFKENANRSDGFSEASINWYDDEDAVHFTMEQRKERNDNDENAFPYGVAIIERSDADRIIKNPSYKNVFSYERAQLDNNKYHGNLLLRHNDNTIKRRIRTQIASALALYAQLIPREQYCV